MTFRLYVDMDGVLADFDRGYEAAFGVRPDKDKDDVDWSLVRDTPNFYRDLPPMPDFWGLWTRIERYRPIVLTGVPGSVPEALENKTAWVRKYLPPGTLMIGCRSVNKATYARPGDVLIDDWEKHRHRWEAAGGRWITHTSAEATGRALAEIGL